MNVSILIVIRLFLHTLFCLSSFRGQNMFAKIAEIFYISKILPGNLQAYHIFAAKTARTAMKAKADINNN